MTTPTRTPSLSTRRRLCQGLFTVALALGGGDSLWSADGDLDPSFGSGGAYPANAIVYDGYLAPGGFRPLQMTSDGKMLLTGYHARSSAREYHDILYGVLVRLAADGSYDTSFGGDGRVNIPSPTGGATAIESAVSLADGKTAVLLVALNSANALESRHIVRLNADGTVDTTFAQNGYATVGVHPDVSWEFDSQLTVDPQGRFLVWGYIGTSPTFFARITRYTATGALDTAWASGGSLSPGRSFLTHVAFDADGSYLLASADNNQAGLDVAQVTKCSATTGALVASFGTGGKASWTGADISRLISTPQGIVTIGTDDSVLPGYPEVRRLSATNGSFDPSWNGGSPLKLTSFGTVVANSSLPVLDAIRLGDGRIAVAGLKTLAGSRESQIVAVGANGGSQTVLADLGQEVADGNIAVGMALRGSGSDERIMVGNLRLAAGIQGRDGNRIRVTNLRSSNGTIDTSFSDDGMVDVAYRTPTLDQALDAFPGPNGTTYTVISAHMTNDQGAHLGVPADSRRYIAVVRQRADGLKDPLFGSGGTASLQLQTSMGFARCGALAPDGGIIVGSTLRLFRFTSGGSQDLAFGGGDGIAQSSNANDVFDRIIVQPDGKILVGGHVGLTGIPSAMVVLRFNANGTIDTTFGSSGRRTFAGTAFGDIALQADGRIMTFVRQTVGGSSAPVLVRLTSTGAVDTAWGASGGLVLDEGGKSITELSRLVAISSGGWFALGSLSSSSVERQSAIWNVSADGTIPSGFGTNGLVVKNVAPMGALHSIETECFTSVMLDSTAGKIYVTGDSERRLTNAGLPDGSESRAYVARLDAATGAFDSTFGSAGLVIWDTINYPDSFPANRPMRLCSVMPSGDSGRVRLVGDLREDTVLLRMLVGAIQQANPPVIAQGNQVTVNMSEDGSPTAFALTLGASDPDGSDLTWSVAEAPIHGTVSIQANASGRTANPLFVPDVDWFGSDTFVLVVSDGFLTDSIRVHVNVESVADTVGGTPDVAVSVLGSVRSNGATVDAGSAVVSANPVTVPFRIANAGNANLVVLSAGFTSQSNCTVFMADAVPTGLAPGSGVDLTASVTPSATGAWSFVLQVGAQDPDEAMTSITISGQALAAATPVVTIATSDGVATEGGDTGTFTLTRTGSTAAALTVTVGLAGSTAVAVTDFTLNPSGASSSVTFPSGSSTVLVTVTAVDDASAESEEFVRMTIASGAGYAPGPVASADVAVVDNDTGTSAGPGDLNGDKVVNINDLTLVTSNFGKSSGFPPAADANGDGVITISDLTIVTSNFGKSYP